MANEKEDELRMLRRLAKTYGISFRQSADEWPEAHTKRFRDIQELGYKKFSTYSESVTVRSLQEPWTRQIKSRTQWLVSRACELAFNVQPKESGWRLGIENDVMHRFLVEVACPRCRARIWRSEIEATDGQTSGKWMEALEERRKNRKPCQCPIETRPQDYYEIGTSLLFDDRVEEIVILDSALKDLPKKKTPDRTFGLKTTEKVNQLLERLALETATTSEIMEFTPFKLATNPPIFPFLILEAKSDSSRNGFQDIQTQTAFPVWKFLTLQRQLQLKTGCTSEEPLVWFLGNRGSEWKVYGCYVNETDGRPRYNIHPLWGGDLTTHDGALQLILIVDYILDWARDIYRPSIMRGLKSLVTRKAYDEVSLDLESDIYSVKDRVFDWIPPQAADFEYETHLEPVIENLESRSDPGLGDVLDGLPKTKLGAFRSASQVSYRFNGLNITEENVESLLIISQGPDDELSMSSMHAQNLDNKLRSCDKLMLTTQHALDEIEYMWTGERRKNDTTFTGASDVEVYVILEYQCFIGCSWEVVRELTCIAVSKPAFLILQECASSKGGYRARDLSNVSGNCPSTSLYEAIECLLSDSALQILQASISSVLLSIYPSCVAKNQDLPSLILEFRALKNSQISQMVEEYSELVMNRVSKLVQPISLPQYLRSGGQGRKGYEALMRQKKAEVEFWSSKYRRMTANRTFARRSTRLAHITEVDGHGFSCSRCSKARLEGFAAQWEPVLLHPSTKNTMLVKAVSLDMEVDIREKRSDFCLFILGKGLEINEDDSVANIVEEHLKSGKMYHALFRGPSSSEKMPDGSVPWNLWHPYRRAAEEVKRDLEAWIAELREYKNPN
ncbi:hypothetical protein F5Y05DRAFT_379853 [Hypoxylon sp. FL0543]|nr:hypothetical protein F5Y05DRAFT_379853 [Hypoxylon sp. FL0543]